MPADISIEDALARLDQLQPDVREAINQLVATRDSPGFLVLLNYLNALAHNAREALVEADALDKNEIIRLQDTVKRFRFFEEAPDDLIRTEVAKELAEEREATVYDDD